VVASRHGRFAQKKDLPHQLPIELEIGWVTGPVSMLSNRKKSSTSSETFMVTKFNNTFSGLQVRQLVEWTVS
jgi:hypothetical protein